VTVHQLLIDFQDGLRFSQDRCPHNILTEFGSMKLGKLIHTHLNEVLV